ncbi:hypothetical protein HPB48_004434 [Haemaphysalis longicornis]|uniref:RNase H type-1 domain-containing protein n=1 Tax=Haemaphysalis longicornis TaxID=44386 RepID=A0A9J6GK51_HAELO|nr:hypothetical protein HPB48_004434 [Haemaphysalis longicornis]
MAPGKMAPSTMAPASRPAARPSRKDDFLAQKFREAHTSQAKSRSKSKSRPDGLTWADVTSGKEHRKRSKSSRRSASGRRSVSKNRWEPVSKSDVTARPAPVKPEPQSVAKTTGREPGRNEERGGGESNRTEQCKAETREMKAMIKIIRASTGELINAGTVRAKTPGQAEEAAIGLAMGVPGIKTILSDSKTAIKKASRTSDGSPTRPTITVKWFPAHVGDRPNAVNRNEEADAAARELIRCREGSMAPRTEDKTNTRPKP